MFLFLFTKGPNAESNTYVFAHSSLDLTDLLYPCTSLNAVCHVYHCLLSFLFASVHLSPPRMNFTSSCARPKLRQKTLLSRIVALIIKVLLHFSNTTLQYPDISRGFNSTPVTSYPSFLISDTIQFLGFARIFSIALVSLSLSYYFNCKFFAKFSTWFFAKREGSSAIEIIFCDFFVVFK